MKQNDLCHPYTNKNGKRVNGSAAFSHHVFTEMGGIQNYNDSIGEAYISSFVKEHSDYINEDIITKEKRKKFKII